ncbi:MAG: FtsB family cell division protein [Gemmatimonadaceae bacterium]
MPRRRLSPRLLVWLALATAAVLFSVQGGEYGTSDLFQQRSRRARLQAAVDSLQHAVDSLRSYRTALAEDPVVQERVAREEFGMIRAGERLYRFAEPRAVAADSGR